MAVQLTRREAILAAGAACAGWWVGAGCTAKLTDADPPTRILPRSGTPTTLPPPAIASQNPGDPGAQDATFGWKTAQIGEANGLVLTFNGDRPLAGRTWLRWTCASSLPSSAGRILISLANSGRLVGSADLPTAYPGLLVQVELSPTDAEAIRIDGARLRTDGGLGKLAIFAASPAGATISDRLAPRGYLPQLLIGSSGDAFAELQDRIASLDSLQPFGWMEGCVLTGLSDLADQTTDGRYLHAIEQHLTLHLVLGDGSSQLSTPKSQVLPSRFVGADQTLMIGVLARQTPGHPLIDQAIRYWQSRREADGVMGDASSTTAFGAYTIAWPMSVVGSTRKAASLTSQAVEQLRLRLRRLSTEADFFQRGGLPAISIKAPAGGRQWSLGVAFWMLGLARTIREIAPADRPAELLAELARMTAWARQTQLPDGLWPGYLGEPESGGEAAGTAGIAAAIAIAVEAGLLPRTEISIARKALTALTSLLTPDGYLQTLALPTATLANPPGMISNIITPYSIGLVAQLLAAVRPKVG